MNQEITSAATTLLARQMYSSTELKKKLLQKFRGKDEEIEEVINYFVQKNFLDDELYTKTYIEYALRQKPQGIYSIKQKIKQKGLPSDLVEKVLEEIEIDEEEYAKEAAEKKASTLSIDLDPQKKKEKLYRFLLSRGFRVDIIQKVISNT